MTTRIGVISDSHVKSLDALPKQLIETLAAVDLIVHAGDFTGLKVYEDLRQLGETKAVRGNMDEGDVCELLPETELLVIEEKKIGIVHGSGSPWGIEERVRKRFDDVDVIIFGHSHIPKNGAIEGVYFFNPGQAKHSCGVLEIAETIKGTIIKY